MSFQNVFYGRSNIWQTFFVLLGAIKKKMSAHIAFSLILLMALQALCSKTSIKTGISNNLCSLIMTLKWVFIAYIWLEISSRHPYRHNDEKKSEVVHLQSFCSMKCDILYWFLFYECSKHRFFNALKKEFKKEFWI